MDKVVFVREWPVAGHPGINYVASAFVQSESTHGLFKLAQLQVAFPRGSKLCVVLVSARF